MNKKIVTKGKQLSKRELKTIAGGMLNCMGLTEPCSGPDCPPIGGPKEPRDYCTIFSSHCAQEVCRP